MVLRIGWKVTYRLAKYGNVSYCEEDAAVLYKTNCLTRPVSGMGPLCVFQTKQAALDFSVFRCHYIEVFRCLYTPSIECTIWNRRITADIDILPIGTVLADDVVLLGKPIDWRKKP